MESQSTDSTTHSEKMEWETKGHQLIREAEDLLAVKCCWWTSQKSQEESRADAANLFDQAGKNFTMAQCHWQAGDSHRQAANLMDADYLKTRAWREAAKAFQAGEHYDEAIQMRRLALTLFQSHAELRDLVIEQENLALLYQLSSQWKSSREFWKLAAHTHLSLRGALDNQSYDRCLYRAAWCAVHLGLHLEAKQEFENLCHRLVGTGSSSLTIQRLRCRDYWCCALVCHLISQKVPVINQVLEQEISFYLARWSHHLWLIDDPDIRTLQQVLLQEAPLERIRETELRNLIVLWINSSSSSSSHPDQLSSHMASFPLNSQIQQDLLC